MFFLFVYLLIDCEDKGVHFLACVAGVADREDHVNCSITVCWEIVMVLNDYDEVIEGVFLLKSENETWPEPRGTLYVLLRSNLAFAGFQIQMENLVSVPTFSVKKRSGWQSPSKSRNALELGIENSGNPWSLTL